MASQCLLKYQVFRSRLLIRHYVYVCFFFKNNQNIFEKFFKVSGILVASVLIIHYWWRFFFHLYFVTLLTLIIINWDRGIKSRLKIKEIKFRVQKVKFSLNCISLGYTRAASTYRYTIKTHESNFKHINE